MHVKTHTLSSRPDVKLKYIDPYVTRDVGMPFESFPDFAFLCSVAYCGVVYDYNEDSAIVFGRKSNIDELLSCWLESCELNTHACVAVAYRAYSSEAIYKMGIPAYQEAVRKLMSLDICKSKIQSLFGRYLVEVGYNQNHFLGGLFIDQKDYLNLSYHKGFYLWIKNRSANR